MFEQQKKKQTLIDKMMKGIPTPPSGPAPAQQPDDVMSTFDGNLSEKPISYLLRAAEHYEITGKLFIGSVHCNVCIQFGLGRAVHATSPLSHGTEAIMDLFIWRDGVIRFEPGGQPETVTVQESISDILIRGEAFIENHNFLENNYINEMSFLLRPPERLAEGELENRLRAARVRDPHLHAEFYSNVYGTRNIKDTAEKMNLSHSQWVNIAADLLKLGLLLTPDNRCIKAEDPLPPMMQPPLPVVNQPPQIILPELGPGTISLNIPETNNLPRAEVPDIFKPSPTREVAFPVPTLDEWHLQNPKPRQVDHNAQKLSDSVKVGVPEQMLALDPMMRNAVWLLLNKSETGILSFEALQFFLEREFARAYRFKTTLSLALFCVTVNPDPLGNMPAEVCVLLTAAVTNIKREVDMFGHFGDRAFGLLLPGVESHQACVLADRINRDLVKLKPDLKQYEPCLHFGIASAPQDATDMEGLAKAAQVAMFIAALHNELKVEANEVSNRQTQQKLSQGQPSLSHSAGDPGETMQLKRPTAEQLGMPFLPSQAPAAPAQPAPPQGFAGFPSQTTPQSAPPFVQPAQQPPPSLPQPSQQAPQFPAQQPQTQPPQPHQPAPQFPPQQPPLPQPFQQQQQPAAPPMPFPQQPAQAPQPPHQQPLQQQPQLPPQPPQKAPQQPQIPPQQPQIPPQPQPPAQPFPHQPPSMPPQTNPFLPQQPPPPPQQPPEQKSPDSSQQQQQQQQQGPNYQW